MAWQWTPALVQKRGVKKSASLLSRHMGKILFEEVVSQGESIAVPVKGVEGSRSAFPDSGISRCQCVGVSFRCQRILSVIVFVFSEIIPH